jgi:hypothetical protein
MYHLVRVPFARQFDYCWFMSDLQGPDGHKNLILLLHFDDGV